jgi:hypothetical protein
MQRQPKAANLNLLNQCPNAAGRGGKLARFVLACSCCSVFSQGSSLNGPGWPQTSQVREGSLLNKATRQESVEFDLHYGAYRGQSPMTDSSTAILRGRGALLRVGRYMSSGEARTSRLSRRPFLGSNRPVNPCSSLEVQGNTPWAGAPNSSAACPSRALTAGTSRGRGGP